MSDLSNAIQRLGEHTIALCRGESVIVSDKRGVAPMLELIGSGVELAGYSVADKVVGKAAAMLFVKAGITAVFARTMSVGAREYLVDRGVVATFDVLTEQIRNRQNNGMCPMEQAVQEISDCEQGYQAIVARFEALRSVANNNG